MEHRMIDPSRIKGWGVDADPKNDPTYPMKRRNDGEHAGYSWERPPQQPINVGVPPFQRTAERLGRVRDIDAPSGLSGMIRRFAFNYSESSYGHWLPLMLADRVNQVEGVRGGSRERPRAQCLRGTGLECRVETQPDQPGGAGCRRSGPRLRRRGADRRDTGQGRFIQEALTGSVTVPSAWVHRPSTDSTPPLPRTARTG